MAWLCAVELFFIPFRLETFAVSRAPKGPHGGQIVTQKGQKFEIRLNQETGQMDVYIRSQAELHPPPENRVITLYKNDQTGQTVRLKSVGPPQEGFIHYQGQVSPSEASSIAIGIQFDLAPTPQPSPEASRYANP